MQSQADSIDNLVQMKKKLDGIQKIKLGLYTDLKQDEYNFLKSDYGQKTAMLTGQAESFTRNIVTELVESIETHEGRRLPIYFKVLISL